MSSVNYEELAKNARAAAKIQEKTEQNTRSWKNAFGLFQSEKVNGKAIEKAQNYYGQLYGTLLEEVNGIGGEIALLSQVQADNFGGSVANSSEYEADSDILEELLKLEEDKKKTYENARDSFLYAAGGLYARLFPAYGSYCHSMAYYYSQLIQQTETIIIKLRDIIHGLSTFESECSGLYENVFSRLAVLETISKELGLDRENVGFELPTNLQESLKSLQTELKKQRISALFAGFDVTIVGVATSEIDLNRDFMCMNGVNDVNIEPYAEYKGNSCAWFVSMVLTKYGGIDMDISDEWNTAWYCNTDNQQSPQEYYGGSLPFINADANFKYFSDKPYTTTYVIKGTIVEKAIALKAMQDAGLYNDGDLLYFDRTNNGEQDHVVILNGRYNSESASGNDKTDNAQNYNDQPAFFGQNENHCSFSVKENLESHDVYSKDTVLTVVAFNG